MDSYVLAWGAGIGHLVLSTPMFVSLKTTSPTGKIIAIGNAGNRQILLWLADLGFVDEVITLPSTLPGVIKLFFKLSPKFRVRFVILHTVKSAKIPWLLSPLIYLRRKSIGFRKGSKTQCYRESLIRQTPNDIRGKFISSFWRVTHLERHEATIPA